MKITGKNSISNYVKIALQIVFLLGIVVLILLPLIVNLYVSVFQININTFIYYGSLVILYISGIPALIIVYQFIQLFDSLKKENPFVIETVKHLKTSAICSFIIAVEYLIGTLFFKTIFTIILVGGFLIAWLALSILAELFKQAVEYKEENDLTI